LFTDLLEQPMVSLADGGLGLTPIHRNEPVRQTACSGAQKFHILYGVLSQYKFHYLETVAIRLHCEVAGQGCLAGPFAALALQVDQRVLRNRANPYETLLL
jgi:hypothetical protein